METMESMEARESIYLLNIKKYNENQAYVLGKNPTIYEKSQQETPDNRIPIPWAKSSVEDLTGYAATLGNRKITFPEQSDEIANDTIAREEYKAQIKEILNDNNDDIETTELYNQALTHGVAYELFWVVKDENGNVTPEYIIVDNDELVLDYTDSIKPVLEKATRFHRKGDTLYADVYYPYYMESWKRIKDGSWTMIPDSIVEYPYSQVPVAVYKINRHEQSLFEAEKSIIDANDNLMSKSLNEVDRFNALIAMFPFSVDNEFKRKLKEIMVIDNLGDETHWPEYLEKQLGNISDFYNKLADRLEKEFHKNIKIPNFSDEHFVGNSSGVALAYKLQGMEFKAALIDPYFNNGVMTKIELLNDVIYLGKNKIEWDVEIEVKRNLPLDEEKMVQMAQSLVGLVSEETLLKALPNSIVPDVDNELSLLENDITKGIANDNANNPAV